ncbi:hypothetical protein BBJ28_00019452 [Nothophytophthora sp. Chile5]|nr:hypothetical protein BBJ28_00019452 [Nothophytophthora sp. Chile5]
MVFVTLKDGSERPRELLADVASRWKEVRDDMHAPPGDCTNTPLNLFAVPQMLWNGGVEVNVYEVAESKLLVGLQKGIFVSDVQQFLKEQREVKEYEWNGKTYSTSTTKEKLHQPHRKKGKHRQRKHGKKAGKKSAGKGPDNDPPSHKRHHHRHGSHQAKSSAEPTTSSTPKQSEPKTEL